MNNNLRKDLIVEILPKNKTNKVDDIEITRVHLNSKDEVKYNKSKGNYVTIYFDKINAKIVKILTHELKILFKKNKITNDDVLVIGLGNENLISDSLGPLTIKNIKVTGYMDNIRKIYATSTSIKYLTGIDSFIYIKSLVSNLKPKLLIIIDSLVTSSIERLNKTIQISDTGISPGSGVNINSKEINKYSMGIPVISIGVPTVIDISYLIDSKLSNTLVTPKDIDVTIMEVSKIISTSINEVLL